jgi:dihydroorotate dehydrogenase
MGSLKDEVLAEPVRKQGRKPIFAKISKTFTGEELAELIELLDDSTVTGRAICNVLNRRGVNISEATLYRYRQSGMYRDLA